MSPTIAKFKRPRAFGVLSTVMMVGHGIVAVATVPVWILYISHMLNLNFPAGPWVRVFTWGFISTILFHLLLMMITPIWHGLAARTQTRRTPLWSWLGYFIPVAGYLLPARALGALIDGTTGESKRLRLLIQIWGIARGLAAPSAMIALLLVIYKLKITGYREGSIIVLYFATSMLVANLLSLLVVGQVRRHLSVAAVDERHAEVFS